MSIDITPETERIVKEELSKGHFRSVDELIIKGVQAWHQRSLTWGSKHRNGRGQSASIYRLG